MLINQNQTYESLPSDSVAGSSSTANKEDVGPMKL